MVGCEVYTPPPGTSTRISADVAHVTCHDTDVTWMMKCEGGNWKGTIRKCDECKSTVG